MLEHRNFRFFGRSSRMIGEAKQQYNRNVSCDVQARILYKLLNNMMKSKLHQCDGGEHDLCCNFHFRKLARHSLWRRWPLYRLFCLLLTKVTKWCPSRLERTYLVDIILHVLRFHLRFVGFLKWLCVLHVLIQSVNKNHQQRAWKYLIHRILHVLRIHLCLISFFKLLRLHERSL